jgi:hypothetical protein
MDHFAGLDVTKSSPHGDGTPWYALDSDGFPPHRQVPPNGSIEAPLPPVRGFSFAGCSFRSKLL